jgi:hypothetical protein
MRKGKKRKEYGPIPNLWEGGYNGEKFFQELKLRLCGGLKKWHVTVLKKVLMEDAMSRIEVPNKK